MRNAPNSEELYVAVVIKRPLAHGAPPPDAPGMAQMLADSLNRQSTAHQRCPTGALYPVQSRTTKLAPLLNRLYLGLGALCLVAAGYVLCLAVTGAK